MSDELLYLTKEIRDDLKEHIKEDKAVFEKLHVTMGDHTGILSDIRDDLNDHMEGVRQNRDSVKLVEKRVQMLEEPVKARQYLKDWAIDLTKMIGSILALSALWKLVSPYLKEWF